MEEVDVDIFREIRNTIYDMQGTGGQHNILEQLLRELEIDYKNLASDRINK